MAIQWDARFSVGNAQIDTQHRTLIEHYNVFSEACSQGKGRGEITRLFGFLDSYVAEHFAAEEALMARHDFPDTAKHKLAHLKLTQSLRDLKSQLYGDLAPPLPVVIDASRMLMKWVFEHIAQEDAALGRHLAKA